MGPMRGPVSNTATEVLNDHGDADEAYILHKGDNPG